MGQDRIKGHRKKKVIDKVGVIEKVELDIKKKLH